MKDGVLMSIPIYAKASNWLVMPIYNNTNHWLKTLVFSKKKLSMVLFKEYITFFDRLNNSAHA